MNGLRVLHNRGARICLAGLVVGASALLGACSPGDPAERAENHLIAARQAVEDDRISEAVIELKNAIQEKPDLAAARLELGRLHLRLARYADAEKELQRALEHGASQEEVWLPLLEALVRQGKNAEALAGIEGLAPEFAGSPEILALHADALLAQGRRDAMRELLGPAEALTDARLLARMARLAAAEGDLEQARNLADRAVAAEPPTELAHNIRGFLLANAGDLQGAADAFARAVDINPYSLEAGMRLAQARMALGDLDEAEAVLEDFASRLGDRLPFASLRAMMALERRDFDTAKREAEKVLGVAPRFRPALFVAGIANAALGNDDTSISQLNRYTSSEPVPPAAFKALAWANLRSGRPQEAVRVLERANLPASDLPALRMAVQAALQSGDTEQAKALLREAVEEEPDDQAGAAASLAALQLATGDTESARKLLSSLPEDFGAGSLSDKARLALLQLRAGNFEQVLGLAEDLKQTEESALAGYALAGLAHVGLEDTEAAIAQFERAIDLSPGNQISALALATLYQREGRQADATEVLRTALDSAAGNSQLLTALVQLLVSQDRAEDAESLLRRVADERPEDAISRALLARLMLVSGRADQALPLANEAADLAPESPVVLETLGRVQQTAGRNEQALATFRRLAELRPDNADASLLLARAEAGAGDAAAATRTLQTLLDSAPDRHDARIVLARLLLLQGNADAAESHVTALKEVLPEVADVIELEAALALARDETDTALEHYRRAFERQPTPERAMTLARLQWQNDRREAAIESLEQALQRTELQQAAGLRVQLGEYRYRSGDLDTAIGIYRALVEADGENALYRNQLAWMLWESGDAQAALPHAEKALELAPDSPEIKDTLGVVLLDSGEAERAVELLREASEARPESPDLRFHYAQALMTLGRSGEARDILTALLEEDGFAERDDVAAMLEELGGS